MERRALGKTGLTVSRIGLGLAALGRPGYINLGHAADLHGDYGVPSMESRAHAVLDAAWQAGIRYYDAARSYGRGGRLACLFQPPAGHGSSRRGRLSSPHVRASVPMASHGSPH